MLNKNFCEMKGKKVIHWALPPQMLKSPPPWTHDRYSVMSPGGDFNFSDMAGGNGGAFQIASWKCNFSIYLDIKVYYLHIKAITTLLGLLLVCYELLPSIYPSIYSFFYLTTTLLKSDIFRHSKVFAAHGFQPTGIGLASLWRGNRCALPITPAYV